MAHDHRHGHEEHSHTHGAVDPSVATSERGIWAVKWSFVGLFATALVQAVVVVLSGSVALLSDTIHNFGDALTAVPLWVAFALSRLGASRRFTFGYGRAEDLAGVIVVLLILFSAVVAGCPTRAALAVCRPPGGSCGVGAASPQLLSVPPGAKGLYCRCLPGPPIPGPRWWGSRPEDGSRTQPSPRGDSWT